MLPISAIGELLRMKCLKLALWGYLQKLYKEVVK